MKTLSATATALGAHAALISILVAPRLTPRHKDNIEQLTQYNPVLNAVAIEQQGSPTKKVVHPRKNGLKNKVSIKPNEQQQHKSQQASSMQHKPLHNHTHHDVVTNTKIARFLKALNMAITKELINHPLNPDQSIDMLIKCEIKGGRITSVALLKSNASATNNRAIIQLLALIPTIEKPKLDQPITVELPINITQNQNPIF